MIREAKTVLSPPKTVAVQGGSGSYQSVAAARFYPDAVQLETQTWEESCQMAQDGSVDLAILPLENTTAGPVNAVYDLLQEYDLYIVASCTLPISTLPAGCAGRTARRHPIGCLDPSGPVPVCRDDSGPWLDGPLRLPIRRTQPARSPRTASRR